ncbi:MAG: hypothetical protein ABL951_01290 [Alphaproteobacteria bacterium]
MKIPSILILTGLLAVFAADAGAVTGETAKQLAARAAAPLFEGLGKHQHAVTTKDPDAQRYFNQGLILAFAFNHAESVRSFKAAQRLDDDCAMCFWGEALATGPNINVTSKGKVIMSEMESIAAYAALQKAIARKDKVSVPERDYIDALAARYGSDPKAGREAFDLAYAKSMGALAKKYPDDLDASALSAEALMNTMPWDYWSQKGEPKPATLEVLALLEAALARNPDHPLAIHLYIHATEASRNPEKAEAAADRLGALVPGAGHLVHMPAHTYWRVGRYHDAAEVNVRAAKVDEGYIAQCNAQGFYPALYYPHNIHFLWSASSMEGRSKVAIDSAIKLGEKVTVAQIKQFPVIEAFHTIPLLALTQFAKWDDILAAPKPLEAFDYSNAIWHYARGVALAAKQQPGMALNEHQALVSRKHTKSIQFLDDNGQPASQLLEIADQLLLGEIALAKGDPNTSVTHFTKAVEIQDQLPYTEPPFWYYPTRQSLGYALLAAKRNAEAEAVYRLDLEHYPRNGWSMIGLILSLEAQDKQAEAAPQREKFTAIWAEADFPLTTSRLH